MLIIGKTFKAVAVLLLLCLLPCSVFFFHLTPLGVTDSNTSLITLDTCSNGHSGLTGLAAVVLVFFSITLFFPVASRLAEPKKSIFHIIFTTSIEKPPLAI